MARNSFSYPLHSSHDTKQDHLGFGAWMSVGRFLIHGDASNRSAAESDASPGFFVDNHDTGKIVVGKVNCKF
ncbi:MAG: hypothetical protein E5Y02_17420 [Mesorhizobium sp.]|nr:MAG: hypothetical protein E5Y02_17420 [Mesorhizobium sp.]